MGTFALRLAGAAKVYVREGRPQPAFQGVDLTVEQGEIYVLLGPSGCGKSTLLRVIAGLEPLSAGQIEVAATPPGYRQVGLVFQEPLLLPWLTVAQNVGLGLGYRANEQARALESVDGLLHEVGLAAAANAYPDQLSGGQAQRASLARTIITRPSILLLDEPFSALDPRTRAALQEWLRQLVRDRGLTAILVTHDVDEALHLGDRIGLMSRQPGTITHTWTVRAPAEAGSEQRRQIRREILERYQTDVPAEAAANWVI